MTIRVSVAVRAGIVGWVGNCIRGSGADATGVRQSHQEREEREKRVRQFGHDLDRVLEHEGVDGEQADRKQGFDAYLALAARQEQPQEN